MMALAGLGVWLIYQDWRPALESAPAASEEGYLFCTWNVENLFDDRDDPQNRDPDEDWFALHPKAVHEKVELLARALLMQNDGRGPDILALVEVENRRAVELLREALNSALPSPWQYTGLIHRDNVSGRRIEPAILTRLAIRDDLTRTFGTRRILEGQLEAEGVPLTVLVSHWTSRLRDGNEEKREAYADVLYEAVLERLQRDPSADILLAGDFNDEPHDSSLIEHLNTTNNPAEVREGDARPRLLDLTARLDPTTSGTYYYNGRWEILDHVIASPGLLDPAGWFVRIGSVRVVNDRSLSFGRDRRPRRFGGPSNPNPRGPSDHFAVTVRLRLDDDGWQVDPPASLEK
jgi:endonuclease/exonuclease/phosphatase family metal-dependent hydrolase